MGIKLRDVALGGVDVEIDLEQEHEPVSGHMRGRTWSASMAALMQVARSWRRKVLLLGLATRCEVSSSNMSRLLDSAEYWVQILSWSLSWTL